MSVVFFFCVGLRFFLKGLWILKMERNVKGLEG